MSQAAPLPSSPTTVPAPARRKPSALKRTLTAVLLLALAWLLWQCGSEVVAGARLSNAAVRQFHSQLDSGSYNDIFQNAAPEFQSSGSREDLSKFLAGVHSKLGASRDFHLTNINVSKSNHGSFLRVVYQSSFEQGSAQETFTWKKENGTLKLVRYDVNSKALATH
jgi:hypothetical protein